MWPIKQLLVHRRSQTLPLTLAATRFDYLYHILQKDSEFNPFSQKEEAFLKKHYPNELGSSGYRMPFNGADFLRLKNLAYYVKHFLLLQYPENCSPEQLQLESLLIRQHFNSGQDLFVGPDFNLQIEELHRQFRWDYFVQNKQHFPHNFDQEHLEFFRYCRRRFKAYLFDKYSSSKLHLTTKGSS